MSYSEDAFIHALWQGLGSSVLDQSSAWGGQKNYGVIYFNVSGYAAGFGDLIEWGRQHGFHFEHDQNLFRGYRGNAVTALPNGKLEALLGKHLHSDSWAS